VQTDIEKVISSSPELLTQKEHIKIEMLPEGLKIELIDTEGKPMFDPGSAEMKPILKALLAGVTEVIRYLPNYIVVEGHSNSIRNTGIKRTYGNWELSADRANAARRFMEDSGIDKDQVARVVAKGDNEPRNTENFLGAENRRIAIIILKRSVLPFHKKVAPDELMEEPNKENTAKYLTLVPAEEKAEAEPAQSTQGVTPLEKNLKTLPQLEAKEGEEKPVSQPLRTITSPTPRMEFSPAAAINADPSAALELPPPEEKKKIIRELPKME
jgi:outer membrane protein OmpA-like peptidoglycan-associated protein